MAASVLRQTAKVRSDSNVYKILWRSKWSEELVKRSPVILHHARLSSQSENTSQTKNPLKKPYTPVGKHDDPQKHRDAEKEPLAPFPNDVNPETGEKGGPRGPEPTRYGDWERKGRCIDF